MARPVRLEFGGALYHVTAGGDLREAIYENDADRRTKGTEVIKSRSCYGTRVWLPGNGPCRCFFDHALKALIAENPFLIDVSLDAGKVFVSYSLAEPAPIGAPSLSRHGAERQIGWVWCHQGVDSP